MLKSVLQILILVLGIGASLFFLLRPYYKGIWLQRLFFLRYPIIIGFVLALWLFVAWFVVPHILGNMLVLSSLTGLIFVTYLAFTAAWVVKFTGVLTWRSSPKITEDLDPLSNQLDTATSPKRPRKTPWYGTRLDQGLALLAVPLLAGVFLCSTELPIWKRLLGVSIGALGLWIVLFIGHRRNNFIFQWLDKQRRKGPAVFARLFPDDGETDFRHDSALFFLLITLLFYAVGYFLFHPSRELISMPPLAYVLLLLILFGWFLPGLSLLLDRFRIPTSLVLVGLSVLSWVVALLLGIHTDHVYPVRTIDDVYAESQLTPENVYEVWADRKSENSTMVIVTASGGGIASALWTTRVLTGLQEELGEAFSDNLLFLSAVSGGSTGVMYYVDAFHKGGPPETGDQLESIMMKAETSSLSEVAWGLTYPDLWRLLASISTTKDRGWALEQAWATKLQAPDATLLSWAADVEAGWRPAAIFNTSVVQTGERMVFSPVSEPRRDLTSLNGYAWQTRYFLSTYPEHDVQIATAARMSAAFPYVSPIARPAMEGQLVGGPDGYFLADGGYFDNFGTVTAIDWLEQILPLAKKEGSTNVLIIEIRLSEFIQENLPGANEQSNWTQTFVGPLVTLLGTWGTTQVRRADVEWDLLQQANPDITIQRVAFIPKPDPNSLQSSWMDIHDPSTVPLSWQLSPEQKTFLRESWDRRLDEREQVRTCLVDGECVRIPPRYKSQE